MIFCCTNVLEQGKKHSTGPAWGSRLRRPPGRLERSEHHLRRAGACADYLAFELDPFFWIQIYFTSLFFKFLHRLMEHVYVDFSLLCSLEKSKWDLFV
jgi:hypothetical protein